MEVPRQRWRRSKSRTQVVSYPSWISYSLTGQTWARLPLSPYHQQFKHPSAHPWVSLIFIISWPWGSKREAYTNFVFISNRIQNYNCLFTPLCLLFWQDIELHKLRNYLNFTSLDLYSIWCISWHSINNSGLNE